MMSLLLSSVSASALLGSTAPVYVDLIEYTDSVYSSANVSGTGTKTSDVSLTFPTAGTYIIAMTGSSGPSTGSNNSPITIISVNGDSATMIYHDENTTYEEVSFALVDITTAGTYPVVYSSSNIYRRFYAALKVKDNAGIDVGTSISSANFHFDTADWSSNPYSITIPPGGAAVHLQQARATTTTVSGFDEDPVVGVQIESGNNRSSLYFSNNPNSTDKVVNVSSTVSGLTSNRMCAVTFVFYPVPAQTQINKATTFAIIGAVSSGLGFRHVKTHAILGASSTGQSIRRAVTHAIIEE